MKKFELCYEIDKKTVLLPDLLEVPEPEFNFDYAGALKFVIDYDFLPRSVMPRFIVKMHRDIAGELRWRTGVVLHDDKAFHSTAVIKADERDEKIYIYVTGEQKRDYFSTIRKTFGDINDSFKKLEARELVPLPDNDEITIEYEELIGYELEGRDEYFIGKLRKGYGVKKLLNGIEKEEERSMKTEGGDKINIHIHDIGKPEVHVEQKTTITIDIDVDLPAIQSEFDELKAIMSESNPDIERKLNEIGDSLDEVTAETEKEKLAKPLNKVRRFLEKINDEQSNYYKIVKGTRRGIEAAQKLGNTYNKFAQWLGLPQVPDLFLGK